MDNQRLKTNTVPGKGHGYFLELERQPDPLFKEEAAHPQSCCNADYKALIPQLLVSKETHSQSPEASYLAEGRIRRPS